MSKMGMKAVILGLLSPIHLFSLPTFWHWGSDFRTFSFTRVMFKFSWIFADV